MVTIKHESSTETDIADKMSKELVPEPPEFIGYKVLKGCPSLSGKLWIWGDGCIHDGLIWWTTANTPVTIFPDQTVFEKAIKKSQKKWPETIYKTVKAYRLWNGEIIPGEITEQALKNLEIEAEKVKIKIQEDDIFA